MFVSPFIQKGNLETHEQQIGPRQRDPQNLCFSVWVTFGQMCFFTFWFVSLFCVVVCKFVGMFLIWECFRCACGCVSERCGCVWPVFYILDVHFFSDVFNISWGGDPPSDLTSVRSPPPDPTFAGPPSVEPPKISFFFFLLPPLICRFFSLPLLGTFSLPRFKTEDIPKNTFGLPDDWPSCPFKPDARKNDRIQHDMFYFVMWTVNCVWALLCSHLKYLYRVLTSSSIPLRWTSRSGLSNFCFLKLRTLTCHQRSRFQRCASSWARSREVKLRRSLRLCRAHTGCLHSMKFASLVWTWSLTIQ